MTRKERENSKLRGELRTKRENGEEGWYIRKGQLVRRLFFVEDSIENKKLKLSLLNIQGLTQGKQLEI